MSDEPFDQYVTIADNVWACANGHRLLVKSGDQLVFDEFTPGKLTLVRNLLCSQCRRSMRLVQVSAQTPSASNGCGMISMETTSATAPEPSS